MLIVKKMTEEHLKAAKTLFKQAYQKERAIVNALPLYGDIYDLVDKRFQYMINKHQGLVAIDDKKVVGYLMYILGDELFGNQLCAFVPLFAHASINNDKQKIYQILYTHASKAWINNKRLSWVVTLFEHDQLLEKFWFKNGFGQRCVDAIAYPKENEVQNDDIVIKKASLETIGNIAKLHKEHNAYYQEAPTCLSGDDNDAFKELLEWFKDENHHLWIAYHKAEALGYMRIEDKGESFITLTNDVVSVTSAYVNPNKRNKGIASILLNEVQRYIIHQLKKKRYGVDYESLNPLARTFWEKHFTPYTKTVARRIDEGILK